MRSVRRVAWVAVLVVTASRVSAEPLLQAKPAQKTAPQPPGAAPQPTPPGDYTFPSGAGMFFFYVKPDKTADFEAVVAKLNEVLGKTQDAGRKQQAASWKIYKSTETPKEGAVYVFVFDPAIVGAEYDPVRVLSEGAPAEVQTLYDRLKDAIIRVERMGLTKIR